MAALTKEEIIKKILLDVVKEEKEHVGEFQTLLLMFDKEQMKSFEEGREEVEKFNK